MSCGFANRAGNSCSAVTGVATFFVVVAAGIAGAEPIAVAEARSRFTLLLIATCCAKKALLQTFFTRFGLYANLASRLIASSCFFDGLPSSRVSDSKDHVLL